MFSISEMHVTIADKSIHLIEEICNVSLSRSENESGLSSKK